MTQRPRVVPGWYILRTDVEGVAHIYVANFEAACCPLLSLMLRPFLGGDLLRASAFLLNGWRTLWLTNDGLRGDGNVPELVAGPFNTRVEVYAWLHTYPSYLNWKPED